jgi:predicted MPP superfamily phosphohydrolase
MIKRIMAFDATTKLLFFGLLISFGFIFLDGIALLALPRLGISYGGVRVTFASLTFLRGGIYLLWLVFLGIFFLFRSISKFDLLYQPGFSSKFPLWLFLGVNILFLLFVIDIFYVEPSRLTVSRLTITVPGLKQNTRIVQLSDIHMELVSKRDLALPSLVNSLQPDMILMTGDYLNESYRRDQSSQQSLRDLVSQLNAPLGIYAVNGNVETRARMDNVFAGMDIHLIDNDVVRIPELGDHFVLIGLELTTWYTDEKVLANLFTQVQPDDYTVLLYHKPDLAYTAQDLGINLYLTGHTHGGQFRLPFYGAVITDARFGKTFEMGRYDLENTIMYVSRGLGMAGTMAPRVRFLCPPEVVVIDLIPGELPVSQ